MLALVNASLSGLGLSLNNGSVIDATLIAVPASTKNSSGKRDPQMHQTKKGNQWHFGMKAHLGADAESGLVQTLYRYVLLSNQQLPQSTLGSQMPLDAMKR